MNNGLYVIIELKKNLAEAFLHVTSKQQGICVQKNKNMCLKNEKHNVKLVSNHHHASMPPGRCVGGVPMPCVAAVSAVSDYRPSTLKCQPKTTTTLSQTSRPAFVSSSLLTPKIIGELKKIFFFNFKKYLTKNCSPVFFHASSISNE